MKRVLFFILVVVYVAAKADVPYALLTDIKILNLYKGRMTNGGRSAPVKQLDCVGGDACSFFIPQVMNCVNIGTDDKGEVQWKCQAQMEDYYRLGQTQISCEGYTNSEDPYILSGSCGLEYTLHLTERGKKHHFPSRGPDRPRAPDGKFYTTDQWRRITQNRPQEDYITILAKSFVVAALIGFFMIGVCCCCLCPTTQRHPAPGAHAVPQAPPPVYYGPPVARAYAPPQQHHHSSGPGFWTGWFLGGGGSGHMSTTSHHHHTTYAAPSSSSYSSPSSSSSSYPSPPSSSSSYSSPPSSSSSGGSTYTSTGFGGTKKR